MKKLLAPLLLIGFIILLAAGGFSQDITYKGDMEIKLNQPIFKSGEELSAEIELFNQEDFPIADSYVIIEIVKGGEYFYPSQITDGDNVFFEEKIPGINIAQKSSKKISFNYAFPENLATGSYRLDVYFKNARAGIVGIPHIFLNPKSVYFSYFGEGSMPEAKIVRSKTVFGGVAGPVGFPAEPNSAIEGAVFIRSVSDVDLTNLKLVVTVYYWDDTAEEEFENKKEVSIDSLEVGEEKQVSVQLQAPGKSSAYAVRIELRNNRNVLLSLYRNRVIVTGATRRIHKLYPNKFYFKKDSSVEINALVGPSPDHFNNPILRDSKLVLSVKDAETGNAIFNQSIDLVPDEQDFLEKKASFIAQNELKKFELCGRVEKGATVYDEYCFTVDATLLVATQKSEIKAEWGYDKAEELLTINFCALSPDLLLKPINALYYLQMDGKTMASEKIDSSKCVEKKFDLPIGIYDLIINNLDTNKQNSEKIDLTEYLKSCAGLNCDDGNPCTSDSCSEGECIHALLADGTACGDGKFCRDGKCVEENIISQYFPYVITVIVLIVIAFLAYKYYLKRRKEE